MVVVTGTLQIVVVVVGGGSDVVVVVSPGVVDVGIGVVVVVVVVGDVVVGVQTGLGIFFSVVVVTGGFGLGLCGGRLVLTTSETVACQRTRVPALGD